MQEIGRQLALAKYFGCLHAGSTRLATLLLELLLTGDCRGPLASET
jgi:hypothetical protein